MGRQAGKIRYDNKGRKLPDGISQRKDGKYQIRITKDGKQHVEYDWELNEAKKKLLSIQGKLSAGSVTNLERCSVNEWYDKWLEIYKKSALKQRTYNNYKTYWNKNIRNTSLGKMRLDKVKQIEIVKLYKNLTERKEKQLAHSTVVYLNTMLGSALQQAMDNGLITSNPSVGAMRHIKGREEKERYALTEEEEKNFMEFISEGRYRIYYNMFQVLFLTGMRSGEMRALTWEDIDFESKRIRIEKSINYDCLESGKQFFITPPKSKSSIRMIPMLPDVEEALKQQKWLQEQFEINGTYEVKRFNSNKEYIGTCKGFVFTTSKGTIATDVSLNRTIRAILKEYNTKENKLAKEEGREEQLLHDFTTHSTRHTFATRSFEKNMNGLCVSGVLGHRSERTTRNIYTHVKPDIIQNEMLRAWG